MSEDPWNPTITTTRLVLTPLIPTDADELVELLGDRPLYRFTGGEPPKLEELRARFERWATRVSPDGRERWLNWVIRDRTSGLALGTLQATVRTEGSLPVAEVAWVLGVEAQGQGYASEASQALVAFLLSKGIPEIVAHVHPDHDASARVASAIGMQPTSEWSQGERLWRLSQATADSRRPVSKVGERIDYDEMAAIYDRGRAFPPEALDGWRLALSNYLSPSPDPLLDLGSGTGIWSVMLADWFDSGVVAIEPSEGMRRRAADKRAHPRVLYLGGEAERIPIKDSSCSHAWLSTVTHHIPELGRCAHELRRVLKPGGRVLIRQAFSGRTHDIVWPQFFPSAHRVLEARHNTVEVTVEAFSVAGFEKESLQSVAEVSAPNLRAYCERIRTRADSSLTLISDEEFERGLTALGRAADEQQPTPVISRLDLLVLLERATRRGCGRR